MRKITFLGLGLTALCLFSCKERKKPVATSSTIVSSLEMNPQKVDELGERYNDLGRFSGSIMVSENGAVVYHEFFGKANYEAGKPFSQNTVFSLGPFSEFIRNDVGEQLESEKTTDSLEVVAKKAMSALIEELDLKNTFLQKQAPQHAATGYVHSIGAEGPETQPILQDSVLQLWTNSTDLQNLLRTISGESLIQDGYSENGGFSYAIRKNGNLSVIVLSNRRHPVAGEMANSVEQLWLRKPYQLPLPRKETKVSPALLKEYAGSYTLGPGAALKVVAEHDSLFVLMGPQKVHLRPQSENQFFMNNSEAAIRFKKDDNGRVSSAELLDGFINGNEIEKQDL
ncbi:MAG: DUF3471 domain-containing protein [Salinimicrobium sp.]